MKPLFTMMVLLFFTAAAFAQASLSSGSLNAPQIQYFIKRAMANTYSDLVKEYNVKGEKKKEWLYSMVCLNMAYLQFGGDKGKYGSTTELNRLIRIKLIQYLPPEMLKQQGFLYSLQ